jgi:hypothetical protein
LLLLHVSLLVLLLLATGSTLLLLLLLPVLLLCISLLFQLLQMLPYGTGLHKPIRVHPQHPGTFQATNPSSPSSHPNYAAPHRLTHPFPSLLLLTLQGV